MSREVDYGHGTFSCEFAEDATARDPMGSSAVASGITPEPVGRNCREKADFGSIKNFLTVRAVQEWNGMVVSSPLPEVFKQWLVRKAV